MFLLLAFLATLVLFDVDIAYRYRAGTNVVFYQTVTLLLVALNVVLFLPVARWGRRLSDRLDRRGCRNDGGQGASSSGEARTSSAPAGRGRAAVAITASVAIIGAILLSLGVRQTIPRIFRAPLAVESSTAPVALLRDAALRIADGESAYASPYDMGGWTTPLIAMPWLVRYQDLAMQTRIDSRMVGVAASAGVGLIGVILALALAERWRKGLAGPAALIAVALLLAAVGYWSLGTASRTFIAREPMPVAWLAVALFAVAVGRGAWIWAGAFLAIAAALSLPLILLAPVFFAGVYGIRKADMEHGTTSVGAFPSLPLAAFLAIFCFSLGPHYVELGALARCVIEAPFGNATYAAKTNQLGLLPGLAHFLNLFGLRPLLSIIVLIFLGETCVRATRPDGTGPAHLLRLLSLTLFVLAVLSPVPSNKAYWPFLAALLVTGGFQALWETAPPSASPVSSPAPPSRRFGFATVAVLGLLIAVVVAGGFVRRVWTRTPGKTLHDLVSTTEWSGHSLAEFGFRAPEGDQMWMNGPRALVNLPTAHPEDGVLTLKLSVVGSKTRETNGLTLELNGETVYAISLPTGSVNDVAVPLRGDRFVVGPNSLVLRAEWADSPAAMGIEGNDTRILAFGFYGLQWQPKSSR